MEMNGTTVIARPVDAVFAYANDLSNDVKWSNGVDKSGLRSGESSMSVRWDTPVQET